MPVRLWGRVLVCIGCLGCASVPRGAGVSDTPYVPVSLSPAEWAAEAETIAANRHATLSATTRQPNKVTGQSVIYSMKAGNVG